MFMEEEFRVKWGVGIRSKRNEGMLSVEANGARRSPSTDNTYDHQEYVCDFLAECDDLCLAQHIQYKADDALVKQIGRYPVIHPCQDMKLGKGIML
jgi:hypothetical protein